MLASLLAKLEGKYFPSSPITGGGGGFNVTNITTAAMTTNTQYLSDDPVTAKIMISMCVTFFVGVLHVILLKFDEKNKNLFFQFILRLHLRYCKSVLLPSIYQNRL